MAIITTGLKNRKISQILNKNTSPNDISRSPRKGKLAKMGYFQHSKRPDNKCCTVEVSIENLTSQDNHLGPTVLYHVFLNGSHIKSCDDAILTKR